MEGFTILHMLTSSISKADEILDDTIHQLQVAFMEGRASPSDMIQLRDGPHSLLDVGTPTHRFPIIRTL